MSRRRLRYSGTHPRRFDEKYKEHRPEIYPETVARILASGRTPAGTHRPVMVAEVLEVLDPQPGDVAVDCTLGHGGHALELLQRIGPGGRLIGLDVDPLELPRTERRLRSLGWGPPSFAAYQSNFAGLPRVLADEQLQGADLVLADLGVSSMQLDDPARGFSVKLAGPLDMRMNPRQRQPASALLQRIGPEELASLLSENADEPRAVLLAGALAGRTFATTSALADVIRRALPRAAASEECDDSIRRVFQALRIAVNDELSALDAFLRTLPACLAAGARVAILTFHSGEDRRVKGAFKAGLRSGIYSDVAREVIRPTPAERRANPRSSPGKLPLGSPEFGMSLLGLTLVFIILYLGQGILIPMFFAGLLAVVLEPLCHSLERRRVGRGLATSISVTLACSLLLGVAVFIGMQIARFTEGLPALKQRGLEYFAGMLVLVRETFGFTYEEQLLWLQRGAADAFLGEGGLLNRTLLTFMDVASLGVLVPLFTFLFLLYRELLVEFLLRLFARSDPALVHEVLSETRVVVKSYVLGLMIETAIVATLNSIALLLLGIEYAILFGVIGGLLNLIPYVGILVGAILPMLMALITTDSIGYPLGVAVVFILIQIVDNNLIVPYVVGSRISLNAIVSIVAVFAGGMLWGISGMFLALPAVAVLKVIFDRSERLKPWGLLFGNKIPTRATSGKDQE